MLVAYNYITAIGEGFPNTQCYVVGNGSVYEDIIWAQGDPIPDKATLDAWIAAKVKADMWKLIQAERDRRKASGVQVGGNWFHSDDTSRIQFLGLLMYGANMPAGIMWKTMSGSFVQMTPTLAQQIFGTIGAKDTAIFTVAETHKAQMNASSDPASYNYLTGTPTWPTVYGE
jgi:hypothetical protein